ncbi:MAG TPA: site-specific integrase [Ktedonobacteraceae bacterium]
MGKRGNGEGSIYFRRSDEKWVGSITLENRKRRVFYGKTRKEVQEKLKVALREQQQGTLVTAPRQTLSQFLTDWLENSQKQSVRPRTYERYEELVRLHIAPALGRYELQKLSAQHLQAFYAKKAEEGLSATTINHFHNVLHKALDTAMRWNLVARNVCDLVSPPRRKRYEVHPLTLDQVHKLLAVVEGHEMEALFKLALATGLRRGELMGLKWQDINLDTGTLQVRRLLSRVPSKMPGKGYVEAEPKTQKSRRSVVIAPFALEALKHHRERQLEAKIKVGRLWQDHDYVFCTSIGTHLNPTRDMLDQLKALLKKAGLPDIRFHDLRHSAATLLLSVGVHPKVVQEILGHSQISITMDVYSHVLPGMQQDAMSRLNAILKEGITSGDVKDSTQRWG